MRDRVLITGDIVGPISSIDEWTVDDDQPNLRYPLGIPDDLGSDSGRNES